MNASGFQHDFGKGCEKTGIISASIVFAGALADCTNVGAGDLSEASLESPAG
jgi:hypothetical protein